MARYDFGGTLADFVVTSRRLGGLDVLGLSAATLTFWSAQTGGTKYTDLQLNGSTVSSITVGTDGQVPKFQGPDGVTEMWADGGSPRVRVVTLQGAPGPAGRDGTNGANGLPGVNAVANDTATASQISTSGTATDVALKAAYGQKSSIDPREYGAKGDGTTDDQAALLAAIAALPTNGTLKLPHGKVFRFHDLAITRSDFTIEGPGALLSTANYTDATKKDIIALKGDNITLRNFKVSCVNAATARPSSGSMDLIAIGDRTTGNFHSNVTIDNLDLEGGFTTCVNFYQINEPTVRNCRVKNNIGNGIGFVQCVGKGIITGNRVLNSQDDAIAVTSDPQLAAGTQRVIITGNIVDTTDAKGIDLSGCTYFQIANNHVVNTYSPGIMVWADTFYGLSETHRGSIVGNTITNAGKCFGAGRLNATVGTTGNGIHVDNGASFITVEANQIFGATARGIQAGTVSDIGFVNNTIYDCASTGMNIGDPADTSRTKCANVLIRGNLIRKVGGGLVLGSVTGLDVSSNQIRSYRNGATGSLRGIAYGYLSRAVMTGNIIVNDDGGNETMLDISGNNSIGVRKFNNYRVEDTAQVQTGGDVGRGAVVPQRTAANSWVTTTGCSVGTGTPTLNRCYFVPVAITERMTATELNVKITTGIASGLVRLGIYTDVDSAPAALVLDVGTVDASTAALKTATFSQSLAPGVYWLAAAVQGAAPGWNNLSGRAVGISANQDPSFSINGYTIDGVSGALPATVSGISNSAIAPALTMKLT